MTQTDHVNFLSASIGNACIQWANLEGLIAIWIWGILGVDSETGAIVTGGLDMLPRVNMAIALGRHKRLPASLIRPLIDVRKAIQDGLGDRRNQAVHGIHADGSALTTVKLTMHRWKGDKRTQEVEINDVRQLGTELNALSRELSNGLDQFLAFRAARADVMAKKGTVKATK